LGRSWRCWASAEARGREPLFLCRVAGQFLGDLALKALALQCLFDVGDDLAERVGDFRVDLTSHGLQGLRVDFWAAQLRRVQDLGMAWERSYRPDGRLRVADSAWLIDLSERAPANSVGYRVAGPLPDHYAIGRPPVAVVRLWQALFGYRVVRAEQVQYTADQHASGVGYQAREAREACSQPGD
jgi:hypothetical protein